jgi:hypothetical protein
MKIADEIYQHVQMMPIDMANQIIDFIEFLESKYQLNGSSDDAMEYDLNQLKVKRRGVLPDFHPETPAKVQVILSLDTEVVEYFKNQAKQNGTLDYVQQIHLALRNLVV